MLSLLTQSTQDALFKTKLAPELSHPPCQALPLVKQVVVRNSTQTFQHKRPQCQCSVLTCHHTPRSAEVSIHPSPSPQKISNASSQAMFRVKCTIQMPYTAQ